MRARVRIGVRGVYGAVITKVDGGLTACWKGFRMVADELASHNTISASSTLQQILLDQLDEVLDEVQINERACCVDFKLSWNGSLGGG